MAYRIKSGLLIVGFMGFAWTACNTADSDATASQPGGGRRPRSRWDLMAAATLSASSRTTAAGSNTPGQICEWTVLNDGGEHSEQNYALGHRRSNPEPQRRQPLHGRPRRPEPRSGPGWPNQFAYATLAESVASFNGTDGPAWPETLRSTSSSPCRTTAGRRLGPPEILETAAQGTPVWRGQHAAIERDGHERRQPSTSRSSSASSRVRTSRG